MISDITGNVGSLYPLHPLEIAMLAESYEFLKSMLTTPSVTGFEQPVARIVRKRMQPFSDKITTDLHGNTIVALNPGGSPRVMLAGHIDQIGLMVKYVNDEGFIYSGAVGGVDLAVLPGSKLTIHGTHGPVDGVIGRKPIHLMKAEERNGAKLEIQDLWIDIGAKDKAAALEKVSVGDIVTYALGVTKLGDDFIAGAGMDDKVGAFVVMEALRICHEKRASLKCALFSVATVQEEIGLRGAHTSSFGVDPTVGIAVDVTHATDNPGADKKQVGEAALGKGPTISFGANINPMVAQLMVEAGKSHDLPYQRQAAPGATGTDANAMQLARAGVATGLIGIPNRYMHTQVEVVSLTDLENSAALLAETILKIGPDTDFIPR
jgi:putative aminopeptidase FrvX